MEQLMDELERLTERLVDDPVAARLLPTALAALREGRADPATAFELALFADCENAAGRMSIGAKTVSHARYVALQMAEVAIPGSLFAEILRMIAKLRPPPDPTPA